VSSFDTDNVSLPTVQITKPPEEATSHAESDLGQASDKFKAAKLDAANKEIDVTEHPAEPTDNPPTFWPIFHDTLRYLLEAQSSVLQKRLTENRETLLGHKDLRLAHLTIGHLIRVMSMDSWMDDIALVSYLTMVVNHENRLRGKQVAIALESFFFEKLRGKEGYDGVRKWTAKLLNIVGGIKDLERILIPLHLDENHWALAVMHLPERQIRLHDSLQIKTRTNVVLKVCWYHSGADKGCITDLDVDTEGVRPTRIIDL